MPSPLPTLSEFLTHGLQPCSPTHPVPLDYTCCICTDSCLPHEPIVRPLTCSKCYFHRDCLESWLMSSAPNHFTCPLERTPLFRANTKPAYDAETETNSVGITTSQFHDLLFPSPSSIEEDREEEDDDNEEETIHTYQLPTGEMRIFLLTPSTPAEITTVFSARAMLEALEHEQYAASTPSEIIRAWHRARSFNLTLTTATTTTTASASPSANILQATLASLAESLVVSPPDSEAVWLDLAAVLSCLQRRFDRLRARYLHTVRRKVWLLVRALRARLRLVSAESGSAACGYVDEQIAEIEACMAAVGMGNEGMARYVLEDCERTMDVCERLEERFGRRNGQGRVV
ncbi:hypothetical protein TW65_08428 [Stemphylium lycopersici]|uniref:RING finger domain protein n=1 Tax=Stemphylium lycopersici TaxID=183478 RepID=A0A364MXY2_STELY|nr:hypothetical protein TW65_08428 [Stemphylium lycopersici]RAR06822.1 RING finger domain protein [Stemphylium lycopersici]